MAAQQISDRCAGAFIRYVDDLYSCHRVEKLAGQVRTGAVARRSVIELPGFCLGQRDEVLQRIGRNGWMDHQDIGAGRGQRNRGEITDWIVGKLFVEADVHREGRLRHQQRIAIGCRFGGNFKTDVAAAPGAVIDLHLLPPGRCKPLRKRSREYVGRATSPHRHDDSYRPCRIALCAHQRTEKRECDSCNWSVRIPRRGMKTHTENPCTVDNLLPTPKNSAIAWSRLQWTAFTAWATSCPP